MHLDGLRKILTLGRKVLTTEGRIFRRKISQDTKNFLTIPKNSHNKGNILTTVKQFSQQRIGISTIVKQICSIFSESFDLLRLSNGKTKSFFITTETPPFFLINTWNFHKHFPQYPENSIPSNFLFEFFLKYHIMINRTA